jgi:kynurenine formamidase
MKCSCVAIGTVVLLLLGARSASAQGPTGAAVDLSYPFNEETVYWPTASPFELTVEAAGQTETGFWYAANSFRAAEHGGTHLDAPIHFAEGKRTATEIPLDDLMGPAVVVDVSSAAAENSDYLVDVAAMEAWEAEHGTIPDRTIVLLKTGWGTRWPDRSSYLGTAELGPGAVADLHFPGLGPDAAAWLVDERQVRAVGIDTASIDRGQSTEFRAHRVLGEANVPIFENVANLDRLPPIGAWVVALPMPIDRGTGGPLRAVAFVPDSIVK